MNGLLIAIGLVLVFGWLAFVVLVAAALSPRWLPRYRLKAAVRRLDAARQPPIDVALAELVVAENEAYRLGWRPEPEGFGRYQQSEVEPGVETGDEPRKGWYP